MNDAERTRLRTDGRNWKRWGPVPLGAGLGDRPRGLQRQRRRVGVLPPRPRPVAGLPVERGRPGRHLRRAAGAVPGLRVLERARPDPQGAHLRPHRHRGQPRRGRQGVLVVPGLDADALLDALALPSTRSASSPTSELVDENRRRGRGRPGVRAARHRRLRRRPLLGHHGRRTPRPRPTTSCIRVTVRNAGPDAATLHVLPTLWFRNTWSWGLGRPPSRRLVGDGRRAGRRAPRLGRLRAASATATPSCCSATTSRTPAGCGGRRRRPTRRTAINDHVVHGRDTVNPDATRHQGGAALPRSTVAGRRDARRSGCGSPTAPRDLGADVGRRSSPTAAAEADEFYADARPRTAPPPTRPWCMRQAFAGMLWSQAVLPLRRGALARRRSRRSRRPRRAPAHGPQRAAGGTSTTTTSSRCPTSGSTRGTPRGTWPSTASRSPTSTRRSPRTS